MMISVPEPVSPAKYALIPLVISALMCPVDSTAQQPAPPLAQAFASGGPVRTGGPLITAVTSPGQAFQVATIEIPLQIPVSGDAMPPLEIIPNPRIRFVVSQNVVVMAGREPVEQNLPPVGRGRFLGRVGNLIREIAGGDEKDRIVARRLTFLFQGDQPFPIQITDRGNIIGKFDVRPIANPTLHAEILSQWWTDFTDQTKRQIDATDMPPWVPTYVMAMLSGRMNLPLPDWYGRGESDEEDNPLLMTLQWIGGAAKVSNNVFATAAAGVSDVSELASGRTSGRYSTLNPAQITALPLPPSIDWGLAVNDGLPGGVPEPSIEPIADRVPPECFYIRYGNFENYLWFQDLSNEYGGDLSQMVTLSGLSNDGAARLQKQLGIQMSEAGRAMGPSVVTDQALIGRDLYLQDGAAMGVVFHPTSVFLLRSSLNNDRQIIARLDDAVTLKSITLTHGKATLLRSTDNAVRSFMVEHDGFICVTNSESIADRFLEVGRTGRSLAKTSDFRAARHWMPLDREDTIFAYFSPEMLQGLLSPQYLIELRRRMQSEADIALVHLARLAARSMAPPGRPVPDEIEPLIRDGFLPSRFGDRADGSGVVSVGDRVIDTRRGGRGTFLPIPDNPIEQVTAAETRWYESIAAAYGNQFPRLDPIFVGVQRQTLPADSIDPSDPTNPTRERLVIHAEIAPWQPDSYGKWAKQLGPPTPLAIRFSPDDVIAVQAHVASDTLGPPTHLFAAIKDSTPPKPEQIDGLINGYFALRTLPGYLGAYPLPGILDRLPLGLGRGTPVGPGMSRLIGGIYRFTGGGFSILSFQPELLNAAVSQLAAEEVDNTAQVRAHVDNLRGSQLEGYFNTLLYERAAKASLGGAEFLEALTGQLGVDPQNALSDAETILGGTVRCPLGGQYRPIPTYAAGQETMWTSTAWDENAAVPGPLPPPQYQAPILRWFRGLDANLTQYPNRLIADVVIEVARQ